MKQRSISTAILIALTTLLATHQAQARTEQFTLTGKTTYGEEGIFFKTSQGDVALNLYTLPEGVVNSLHKYNLNKGACIVVNSDSGFLQEDGGGGSGIHSIKNCAKAPKRK